MFERIRPYTDFEAVAALQRLASNPLLGRISAFLYPGEDVFKLREAVLGVRSVDEFQSEVVFPAVGSIISQTVTEFSVGGLENLRGDSGRLFISNHRDIVLDPAFLQYALHQAGEPFTDIAAGNNLIGNPVVADLMKCNRMVTVFRDGSQREMLASSAELSSYIRQTVFSGKSMWVAQRQGRAKDGNDITEQGVLKMLSMSGTGNFVEDFSHLHIIPMAISYEYEPCGVLKARENLLRAAAGGEYHKVPGEDLNSILTGIMQKKGRVHLEFCQPITGEEFADAAAQRGNERFRALAAILDARIRTGYHIWPTPSDAHINAEVATVSDVDPVELKKELMRIYAAPLLK